MVVFNVDGEGRSEAMVVYSWCCLIAVKRLLKGVLVLVLWVRFVVGGIRGRDREARRGRDGWRVNIEYREMRWVVW